MGGKRTCREKFRLIRCDPEQRSGTCHLQQPTGRYQIAVPKPSLKRSYTGASTAKTPGPHRHLGAVGEPGSSRRATPRPARPGGAPGSWPAGKIVADLVMRPRRLTENNLSLDPQQLRAIPQRLWLSLQSIASLMVARPSAISPILPGCLPAHRETSPDVRKSHLTKFSVSYR